MRNREIHFLPVSSAFPDVETHKKTLVKRGVKVSANYYIDLPGEKRPTYGPSLENFERLVGHMIEEIPTENSWQNPSKTSDLTFFAYHGGVETMQEIGKDKVSDQHPKGVSKEAVRSQIERDFTMLHKALPERIENNFPKEVANGERRDRLDIFIHRQDDRRRQVIEMAMNNRGIGYKDLKNAFPHVDLTALREDLRQFGVSFLIPYGNGHSEMGHGLSFKNWVDLQRVDALNSEVQEALNNLTNNFIMHRNHNFPLVYISDLKRKVGIHIKNSKGLDDYNKIVDALLKHGIPHRLFVYEYRDKATGKILTHRYLISAINQRDQILSILENDSMLEGLREEIVHSVGASYKGKLPTTAEFNTDKYVSIGSILHSLGVTKNDISYTDLLADFPFPVFKYGNNYRISAADYEEIRDYLMGFLTLSYYP